jgi:hypothetical protein
VRLDNRALDRACGIVATQRLGMDVIPMPASPGEDLVATALQLVARRERRRRRAGGRPTTDPKTKLNRGAPCTATRKTARAAAPANV